MSDGDTAARDGRVLVLAPTRTDASNTEALLSKAGIPIEICATFDALVHALELGAAAILIAEEALSPANTPVLGGILSAPASLVRSPHPGSHASRGRFRATRSRRSARSAT